MGVITYEKDEIVDGIKREDFRHPDFRGADISVVRPGGRFRCW